MVTPERLRPITPGLTTETRSIHEESFKELVASDITVTIIMGVPPLPDISFEYLYDLGLRRGKNLFMGIEYLTASMFLGDPDLVMKKKELAPGAIQFLQKAFIGDFGKKVYDDFYAVNNTPAEDYGCTDYDVCYGLALNFDRMLLDG
jgi:hypothetical protein